MISIQKLSFSLVIDTDFYIVGAIGFLVVFINFCAYGCHNFFSLARKNSHYIFVTFLREVQQKNYGKLAK